MEFRVIEYAPGAFYLETNSPVRKWSWAKLAWHWPNNWQRVKDYSRLPHRLSPYPDKVFKSDEAIMAEVDKIKNYPRTVKQFII